MSNGVPVVRRADVRKGKANDRPEVPGDFVLSARFSGGLNDR